MHAVSALFIVFVFVGTVVGCGGGMVVEDVSNDYDGLIRLETQRIMLPTEGGRGRAIRGSASAVWPAEAAWPREIILEFGVPTARNVSWVLDECGTLRLHAGEFEYDASGRARYHSELSNGTARDFEWLETPVLHSSVVEEFIDPDDGGGRVCQFEFELNDEYRTAVQELIQRAESLVPTPSSDEP